MASVVTLSPNTLAFVSVISPHACQLKGMIQCKVASAATVHGWDGSPLSAMYLASTLSVWRVWLIVSQLAIGNGIWFALSGQASLYLVDVSVPACAGQHTTSDLMDCAVLALAGLHVWTVLLSLPVLMGGPPA
ncbi:hypothetical protein EDC04DRAFT_2609806 [Pisolithus marmoratus]|nr:hypothetical protein EDC04DRAFT_2609806 [Pisolithus marmoratus]